MLYKIGLCDDEVFQLKVNNLYLKEIAQRHSLDFEYHAFTTGKQLKTYLEKNKLDVLFLDIDLGKDSGIEIAAWLAREYPEIIIIFVTGHREFAQEAFDVDAVGYLVKPFDEKRMENVVLKMMAQLLQKNKTDEMEEIIITEENLKKKIACRDILYIEKQQARSIIVTEKKQYPVYETITSLCDRLGKQFVRVNQGEIVNKELIREIKGNVIILDTGKEMSIGRTYRKEVIAKYFNE